MGSSCADENRHRFRHQEILHPRRAGYPHDDLFQGLSAALLVVSQPGESVAGTGVDVSEEPLHRLWGVPGGVQPGRYRRRFERQC